MYDSIKLLEEAKSVSIKILKHFLNLLNIDNTLLDHLYNIDICIDHDGSITNNIEMCMNNDDGKIVYVNAYAVYEQIDKDGNNRIYVNKEFLEDVCVEINSGKQKRGILLNLCAIIIHEMYHANRDIVDNYNTYNVGGDFDLISFPFDDDNSILKMSDMSMSIEESIVEAITNLSIYSLSFKKFDLQQIMNLYKRGKLTYDQILACELIDTLGSDFIVWFILSSYQSKYENMIEQKYGDNYYKLAEYFDRAYKCAMSNVIISDDEIIEYIDFIKNKYNNKKITLNFL